MAVRDILVFRSDNDEVFRPLLKRLQRLLRNLVSRPVPLLERSKDVLELLITLLESMFLDVNARNREHVMVR